MKNLSYKFFVIWSFFIPITSFVINSEIKGSLISYILAFISPCIVLLYKRIKYDYLYDLFKVFFIWLIFVMTSQILNMVITVSLDNLILITPSDKYTIVFRNSLFTQSIYCLPGILLYLYAKYFYNKNWDKWIMYSIIVFILYGFYRMIFYSLTRTDGDFISNRFFGEDLSYRMEYQVMTVAGIVIERMQSLAGEPSMFAFIVLPYFIFLLSRKVNIGVLFIIGLSLLLSTSTTAYLGLLILILVLIIYKKINYKYVYIYIIAAIGLYYVFHSEINNIVQTLFITKLSEDSDSTLQRMSYAYNHFDFWCKLDILHMLFGIGFGYIRSTDMFTTFLVNIGIIGLLVFTYYYLKDLKIKAKKTEDIMYNAILLVVFFTAMISVPEYSYLSFWLFLGIIRNKYNKNKLIMNIK